jgi:hypothetical protein
MMVVAGVVVIASGSSSLVSPNPTPNAGNMVKAGIAVLTASWVILVGWAIFSIPNTHHVSSNLAHRDGTLVRYSASNLAEKD